MLSIICAKYIKDYQIELEFNDSKRGVVDLQDFIMNEKRFVFLPLKDKENFKSFELNYTLTWQNREIDLAPEFLYFQTFKKDVTLQDKFKKWGYVQ